MEPSDLELVRARVAGFLSMVEPLFTSEVRLSLVARHTANANAHILVTKDTVPDLRRCLDELERDDTDWQARALAAEAEVGRLRRALGAGFAEAHRAASVMSHAGASRVADALRSGLTPGDLAAIEEVTRG